MTGARQRSQALRAVEEQIDDEFAEHIELLREELVNQGMCEEEASAEAARRFGNPLALREQCIAIVKGDFNMWMRVSIALNILLLLIIIPAGLLYMRAASAANSARQASLASQQTAMLSHAEALRRAIWRGDAGVVEVRGLVRSPGTFDVSIERPRSLRELIEAAGGALPEATQIIHRRAGTTSEEVRSIQSLDQAPTSPVDVSPGPGDVVDVR